MIDPGLRTRLVLAFPATRLGSLALVLYQLALEAHPSPFHARGVDLADTLGVSPASVSMAWTQLAARKIVSRGPAGYLADASGAWSPAFNPIEAPSIGLNMGFNRIEQNSIGLNSASFNRIEGASIGLNDPSIGLNEAFNRIESPSKGLNPKFNPIEQNSIRLNSAIIEERAPAPARIKSGGGGLNSIQSPLPPSIPPGPRDLPVDPVSGLAATEGPDGRLTPIGSLPDPKGTPEYLRLCDRAEALFPQLDFPFQIDAYRTTFPVAWIMRAVEDKGANSPRYRPKHFRPVLSLLREWQANDPPGPPPIDATPAGAGPRPYGPPAPMTPEESRAYHQRLQDEIDAREAAKEAEAAAIAAQAQAPPPGAAPTNPQALVASLAAALKDPHRGRQQAG
jgi:hypothetical protein